MSQKLNVARLLDLLVPRRRDELVRLAAAATARACRVGVAARVRQMASEMSPAQFRGYVRAHGGVLLRHAANSALRDHKLGAELHPQVVAAAGEELARLISADLRITEASPRAAAA